MQPEFYEDLHAEPFDIFMVRGFEVVTGIESPLVPRPSEPVQSLAAEAYINHGRWVVDCPACPNAVLVSKVTPYFLCSNKACVLKEWIAVVMPAEDFEALGAEVMKRPNTENQSWNTSERLDGDPVEFIKLENRLHGVT